MTQPEPVPANLSLQRYRKQILFEGIQQQGQNLLAQAHCAIVGCGALGSALAETLARSGVGSLTIIDRDFVDLSNLQRQHLFDEHDVQQHQPKAIAASKRLQQINSSCLITPHVADLTPENIHSLLSQADLILDGTDNFETRFLINDFSLQYNKPWISAGVIAAHGQVITFIPGKTPCLRCIIPEPPPQTETCDSAGVIAPAVNLIAALQASRALKFIASAGTQFDLEMTIVDVWRNSFKTVDLSPLLNNSDCPACHHNQRSWLHQQRGSSATTLCGRNSVQITPSPALNIDLIRQHQLWQPLGKSSRNPFLLHFVPDEFPQIEFHLFKDGRAIIQGTEDLNHARSLYNRYLST